MNKCNNCHRDIPANWEFPCCPYCGMDLLKVSKESSANINIGDANAFAGDVQIDSHNITNITNVERDKSSEELKQEAFNKYRVFCEQILTDGIIDADEAKMLDTLRINLGISKYESEEILNNVKEQKIKASFTTLNPIAKMTLKQMLSYANEDKIDQIKTNLPRLQVLAQRYTDDWVQFYYYLFLSSLFPEKIIELYESRIEDNYWMEFFVYIAYLNTSKRGEAESALTNMYVWTDRSEGNIALLASIGMMYDYWDDTTMTVSREQAEMMFNEGRESISEQLSLFAKILPFLLTDKAIPDESICNLFYVKYLLSGVMQKRYKAHLYSMLPKLPKIDLL